MSDFKVPARPWGDAEVKMLLNNVHQLDEETRAELGLGEVVEEEETEEEDEDETEEEETEVTTPAPTTEGGLPTDTEGVDNLDATKA